MPSSVPGTQTFQGETRSIITVTTNVKTTGGRLARILVSAGVGAIDVYDHASANSNPVFSKASSAVGDIYAIDCPMLNGIRVVMAAAGSLTVIWS